MSNFAIKDPLWLLALAVLALVFWLRGRTRVPVLLVPFAAAWHRPSVLARSRAPVALAAAGLAFLIGALARPQLTQDLPDPHSRGYDIVLAIDLSGSMLSEDYIADDGTRMNRLQTIKPVIEAFIKDRPSDRIGAVVFSGHAYTLSPLTTDHAWLLQQVERMKIGIIEDGTAIGDALGIALSRLNQGGPATGRRVGAFIVLLTDGANNMGTLAPMQAAAIAKARGIPIYTIGAGKDGIVPYPIFDDQGNKVGYTHIMADLDEDALRSIANTTGGHFFRAAETGTVQSAFRDIDHTEKIQFQAKNRVVTTELFPWLAVPGLVLLAAGALLARVGGSGPTAAEEALPQTS